MSSNAEDLEVELEWLMSVILARLESYFEGKPFVPNPPPLLGDSPFGRFVDEHSLSSEDRLILILALTPHVRPHLLDPLWTRNAQTQRGFAEFGGWAGIHHGGFLPTGETAAFLVCGDDLGARFELMHSFDEDHLFARLGVLELGSPASAAEPILSGALILSREYLLRLTRGAEHQPAFGSDFPARRIHTAMTWEQLVLPDAVLGQLEEIRHWIQHSHVLMDDWGMRAKLMPGFTSLFHGPPGTGKTLSACLLGKHCNCPVYRIDLSLVVSKYIGETEKNLARIFDLAEHRDWILFFDEADALFGRRTRVDDSHDRYANQEISFLLQRIEAFDGVVILASNMNTNIDDAFLRRFQSIIQFPMPKPPERERIWREAFSTNATLADDVDLTRLAARHELSGGTIMNVVRYASLEAIRRADNMILAEDLDEGIRRELQKEGRSI
jgi:hypothetical protein